jgi:cytoskeletal protein CcmA (bactofilin family)
MWFVTHSPSNAISLPRQRFFALALVAVLAVLLPSLTTFAALITTDRYIVRTGETIAEDQYVTSTSAFVEGAIDGDLTIFSGSVTITGEVLGSVTVFSVGTVTVADGAHIAGSLRGTAGTLRVAGAVDGDVFVAAASVILDPSGTVGRDVMGFGGALTIGGDVGRDVRGRTVRTEISGDVGGDVDIASQNLAITGTAVIGGDVLYRSPSDATIDEGAEISGSLTRLPTRGNFIYGVILSLATVVSLLGFLVAGIVALWLFRTSSSRAVGSILRKPLRSILVGLVTVIAFPAAVVLLGMTLVGLPLAIIGVLIGVIAFIIGPVPAVTALGNRVLWNRGGLFGAFTVGALIWGIAIWLIPVVGGVVYVLGSVWGIGAWVMGFAAARRGDPTPPELLPSSLVAKEEIPADWLPPLAPKSDPASKVVPEAKPVAVETATEAEPEIQWDRQPESREPAHDASREGQPEQDPSEEDPPPGTDSWGLPTK